VFVPTPVQPPESPRVRELSQRIQDLIRDFQRQYPMTSTEIHQALRHAGGASGAGRRPLVTVVVAGVVTVLGVGLFLSRGAGTGEDAGTFPVMVVLAVVAALMAVVVAIKRSR
jgi:hypothetical protein